MFRLIGLPIFVVIANACVPSDLIAAEKPHIVYIMVDDMGYGDPGCFNAESKIRTPNIDSVARDGMRFVDAHASGPLCHMSRYGLLTGKYPFRTNVNLWPTQPLIEQGQATLPSVLKKAGYRTAMVGKWHLGFLENGYENELPGGPVDVGFDSFFGIRASTDIPDYFYIRGNRAVKPPTVEIAANSSEGWSPIQGAFWRQGLIAEEMHLDEVLPRFTDEAISVIEQHDASAEPLFLYLAYPAPHTPWLPSEQYRGKSDVGMYGDFAEMTDGEIGRVLAALKQKGLSDQTLLVITSDNGPVWYDEDVGLYQHDSAGPLRGMKADIWEAGHRMPFVARWPGVVKPGTESEQLISFVDMIATFAELTGVSLDDAAGPDSVSFASILTGQPAIKPLREELVLQAGKRLRMLRQGKWKLIDGPGSGGFSGRGDPLTRTGGQEDRQTSYQLYDLSVDLGEQNNLAEKEPERVTTMLARLQQIADQPLNSPHQPK